MVAAPFLPLRLTFFLLVAMLSCFAASGPAASTVNFERTQILGEGEMLTSVFSPSGQHFALATPREIRLYDHQGGLQFRVPQAEPFATHLQFVGNTHLLTASSTRVQEWNLKGEPLHSTRLDLGSWQEARTPFLA